MNFEEVGIALGGARADLTISSHRVPTFQA
jgi:hypothetical protein